MTSTRAALLALAVIATAAAAHEPRPERTRLFPMSHAASAPGIGVGTSGAVHILYPSTEDVLRHAWRERGRWRDEALEDELSFCCPRSVVVDGSGRPHVAYIASALTYGVRTDSGWELTELGATRSDVAIAFRPGDRPALLHDGADGNLQLRYLDDGAWSVQPTGLVGIVEREPQLAFDADGAGHLLFYRGGVCFHATDRSGTWTGTALFSGDPGDTRLALDPEGRAHVVATPAPRSGFVGLLHYREDESGWSSELAVPDDQPGFTPVQSGILIDPEGRLFITYNEGGYIRHTTRNFPRFSYHDGVRWRRPRSRSAPDATVLDATLGAGGELHMACAGFGLTHLSFALPDLAAEWDAMATTPAVEGLRARGTLRIRNLGAGKSAPTRIRYFLSDDDRLDDGDEPVGRTRRVDAIRPGREREIAVSILLPSDAAGRHLLAVVDPDERRDDLDRPNNTASFLVAE